MADSTKSLLILKYHHVSDIPDESLPSKTYVSTETFCTQLDTLLKKGYYPIAINDLTRFLYHGSRIPDKSFLVTFDGGYQDIYTNVLFFLEKYSIPAHVFLIYDMIEENWLDGSPLRPENDSRFLSLSQIQKLKRTDLISFGSHTKTHRRLTKLTDEKLYDEIIGSKVKLEKLLNTEVDSFCYPYGDLDDNIRSIVKEAGYKTAFVSQKSLTEGDLDPLVLTRVEMHNDDKSLKLWWKIRKAESEIYDFVLPL